MIIIIVLAVITIIVVVVIIIIIIIIIIMFYWEHGEESLQAFINENNSFHPTIKFTADWSKGKS